MRGWLLLLLALALPARAAFEDSFTEDERTLLSELDKQSWVKSRETAQKVLQDKPRSFVAAWAMALVHHYGEGNHARALAWIHAAGKRLNTHSQAWDRRVIMEEADILGEMDRADEQLVLLDRYDTRYGLGKWKTEMIFPLVKVRRYQEARALAEKLLKEYPDEAPEIYNGLINLTFEQEDREALTEAVTKAVEAGKGRDCTILRNAAAGAITRVRLEDVDKLLAQARKLQAEGQCYAPVDDDLAFFAVQTGRFVQAAAALKEGRSMHIQKRYRPHFAFDRRIALLDLLDALGKTDDALQLATEIARHAQRQGMNSGTAEYEVLSRITRYVLVLDAAILREREKASYASLPFGPLRYLPSLLQKEGRRWEARRKAAKLLAENNRMLRLLRPGFGDWTRPGDLIHIVGEGPLRATLRRVRAIDATFSETTPYYDALEGELAFRNGDDAEAVKQADAALAQLPKLEALLRWRVTAWRGASLRRLGRIQEAHADELEVLEHWPTAFRALNLTVPIAVSARGTEPAKDAASRLRRSSRFKVTTAAPFHVVVEGDESGVTMTLSDPSGAQLASAKGKDADSVLDAFHETVLSPKVTLTETDLRSLDGSPIRVSVDEALKKLQEP